MRERLPHGCRQMGEDDTAVGRFQFPDDASNLFDSRHIDDRAAVEVKDEHVGLVMDMMQDVLEHLDRSEEERAFDAEDDLAVARHVSFRLFADVDRIGHPFREQGERTDDPDLDGDDEVDEHGQTECDQEDERLGRPMPQHLEDMVPLRHVPSDAHQNRRERGERDVARERCQYEHGEKHRQPVDDTGAAADGTGLNVRRRPGDGARRRDAAEEWDDDVGETLPEQFLVRVHLRTDHPVRDRTRQQRLERPEEGDGERRWHERPNQIEVDREPFELRQSARDTAVGAPDRRDFPWDDETDERRHEHRHQ